MPWLSEENYKSIRNYLIYSQDKEAGKNLIKLVEDVEVNRGISYHEKQFDHLENFETENLPNNEKVDWVENVFLVGICASFLGILLVIIVGIPTGLIIPTQQITFLTNEDGSDCIKINNPYPSNSGIEKVGVRINDPDLDNITKESSETYCGEGRDLINELPLSKYELIFEDIEEKNK